jgi:hypothetical protein
MKNYINLKIHGKKLGGSESCFLPQKCAKTRLHASAISKRFSTLIFWTPVKMEKGWDGTGFGEGKERKGDGEKGEGRKGMGGGSCLMTFRSVVPPLLLCIVTSMVVSSELMIFIHPVGICARAEL